MSFLAFGTILVKRSSVSVGMAIGGALTNTEKMNCVDCV